jgi:hypothetical protein
MAHEKIATKIDEMKDIIQKIVIWNERLLNMSVLHPQRYNHFIKRINLVKPPTNIDELQASYTMVSNIMKDFGTELLPDLLKIVIGSFYVDMISVSHKIVLKHCHPISYHVVKSVKSRDKDVSFSKHKRLTNVDIHHSMKNKVVDFFELSRDHTLHDFIRVNGIRIAFNKDDKSTLIVDAICDDVILSHIDFSLKRNLDKDDPFHLTYRLKELLIYNEDELKTLSIQNSAYLKTFERKDTQVIINEFVNDSLFLKRRTLMSLILSDNKKLEYIGYLLYDILGSNDEKGSLSIGNNEAFSMIQKQVYDILPHRVKDKLNMAIQTYMMKHNNHNISINNLSYEKQICLLDCHDTIKEKAIKKLAEMKGKDDTNSSKARQYLEALLKIPFGKFKCEYNYTERVRELFNLDETNKRHIINVIREKETMNKDKQRVSIQQATEIIYNFSRMDFIETIKKIAPVVKRWKSRIRTSNISKSKHNGPTILYSIDDHSPSLNSQKQNVLLYIKDLKLRHSGLRISELRDQVLLFFNMIVSLSREYLCDDEFDEDMYSIIEIISGISIRPILSQSHQIVHSMRTTLNNVVSSLDEAVHGHTRAKSKLQHIISQWMTGDSKGYCLGFEGPPGVGKTSLAKYGVANCFKNENGETRPFGFIALGGSSRSNILVGHSYTYVGSTWGKIADILMETRCMNPIIYIDELDKISNTDHGQELVGILTHLIDDTQNDRFQDQYFGFDLDLSRVLFIFSYNDVSKIDPILLDRIHRIQFDNLSLEDKYSVLDGYLMPELCGRFGFKENWEKTIRIDRPVYKHIIENYTNESGVRKLKEIMYDIISSINIQVIEGCELPINVTIFNVDNNYLKERRKITHKTIHCSPKVGCISGLWANSLGMGGVMMIQTVFIPCKDTLELKLTGMQGDVMKESMNVARTVALQMARVDSLDDFKNRGIHIHCPEGATPKDGPSAGGAICMALYSLLTGHEIPHDVALTGELSLTGDITAIGGLEHKIVGGVRAGVKKFFYPRENEEDFLKICDKFRDNMNEWEQRGITFTAVDRIEELRDAIFGGK